MEQGLTVRLLSSLAQGQCGHSLRGMEKDRMHRSWLFLMPCLALMSGCGHEAPPLPEPVQPIGGCAGDQHLPPLKLGSQDQAVLASRSNSPHYASDYYFALPAAYFSGLENTPERRVTFIEKSSLTARYLHAQHWFECDGGGFDVTIRVFDTPEGHLIGISSSTYGAETLFSTDKRGPGVLESITVQRPQFWRYRGGQWQRVPDSILPMIQTKRVMDLYRNEFMGHLNSPDQGKLIWLSYDLPAGGSTINVSGRENFMDPSEEYTWARYEFNGERFQSDEVEQ